MRGYLLDSTPLAALLNERPATVSLVTPWIKGGEAGTSVLSYAEVVEYIASRVDAAKRKIALRQLLRGVKPYGLTYAVLERYGEIRRRLRPPHGPGLIGDIDTLIAATALEHDLTLVTTDSDFERVPSLQVLFLPRK